MPKRVISGGFSELAQAVLDSLAAHIVVLDRDGLIIATNEAWERFARENSPSGAVRTGIGTNYLGVCRGACGEGSEGAAEVLKGLRAVLKGTRDRFYHEYPCHGPHEQRWFLLEATGLKGSSGGAVLLHINITERKLMEGKLLEHERLRLLATGLLTGQEEERKRIARELHDGLNQELAVIALELGLLNRETPKNARTVRRRLRSLQQQAVGLSEQVRRISHQLHPATLEHAGLAAALKTLCDEFSGRDGLRVELSAGEIPGSIPAGVKLCLYRVTQECLRNIQKHSGARRARVRMGVRGQEIELEIVDDGGGFDPGAAGGSQGLGLVSMPERVRLLNGSFAVQSRPNAGTRIEVRLPLHPDT